MNCTLKGKVVIVTGASAGVGRAVVRLLAKEGACIGLLARGTDGLEAARGEAEALGTRAVVCPADVSRPDEVEAAATAVERELGPIDVWVNNAMVSMYAPFVDMEPDEFKHIVEVTLLGFVHGTRAALKRMIPRNQGVIIQVGSALAYRSIPLQSAYCASKHGIQGFTESLRSELLHDHSNVRISMVNLPGVNTTQFIWTRNKMPLRPRPTGTIYQPELAAEAIVFAIKNERRQVFLGYPTLQAVIGEKFIPGVLDKYLAHAAWEGAFLKQPADPRQPDNFWKPLPGDHGAHGPFAALAKRRSVELWAVEHRSSVVGLTLAGLAAAGMMLLGRAVRRRRHPEVRLKRAATAMGSMLRAR